MPKDGVELMPEPEDRAILTAVDRGAEGYTGEDYGLSDKEARDLRRPMYTMVPFVWPYGAVGGAASIVVMMLLWPMAQLLNHLAPLLADLRTLAAKAERVNSLERTTKRRASMRRTS